MRSYQHAMDTISSCSQCIPWPIIPLMLAHQPTPHSIETTPQALYTELLSAIPNTLIHISTHFTNIAIQKFSPNTILGAHPWNTPLKTHTIPSLDWVHLSRFYFKHHLALATYHKRIDDSIDEVCIHCNSITHSLSHIMTQSCTHTH